MTFAPLLTDGTEPMATVVRDLARVAPSRLPILLLGPTGSGKEVAARELHRLSGRRGPLVAVNCSAFPEHLMEAEVFGHVKGAFTGAIRDRVGAIEAAQAGTLFLDEVAELPLRLQALLLRVLQEREVRRLGCERTRPVDVRFLAATHQPLEALARSGAFRWDLLYRLQGSVLELPALAARRHEFPYLVPRLLAALAQEEGYALPNLEYGLAEALAGLPWPGNFRELRHSLERALLCCGQGPMAIGHFPELLKPTNRPIPSWSQATREFQRDLLLETLRRNGFSMTLSARALGLTRPAVYAAARRLGLSRTDIQKPGPYGG